MEELSWKVYILECSDGTYYTGITNNIEKRMKTHKNGTGSKYVKNKGFKKLISFKECKNRSQASKEEYKIKQLSRKEKLNYFFK